MSATTAPEESVAAVPELEDFDFPLTDGAACRIDDPDCEACQ
jgi:ribonucleoside-diphosphate reductase alpha chain